MPNASSPQWSNRIVRYGTQAADQFTAHPNNPRRHPQAQREAVKGSLDTLGWIAPVVINVNSGFIVDGHERVMQALGQGDDTPVPFIEVDLSDEEEALALASFDWITQMATYDQQALTDLLSDIDTDNEALQALLDDLASQNGVDLGEEEPLEDAGPQMDQGDALAQQYGTSLGQVWQLGRHRLAIGDSTDKAILEALMQGEKADAVFSDPPYGMKLDTSFSYSKGNTGMGIKATKGYAPVVGDSVDYDAGPIFDNFPNLKECFLFGADYYVDTLPNYGKGSAWMVWDKKNENLREVLGLADFELIWSLKRHKRRVYNFLWNGALGTESEDTKGRVHPTQKPARLLEAIIEEYIDKDYLVVDPYAGSGSTLIACERLGRKLYSCEISPAYAAVIIHRWETLTGKTATLLTSSDTSTHEIPF